MNVTKIIINPTSFKYEFLISFVLIPTSLYSSFTKEIPACFNIISDALPKLETVFFLCSTSVFLSTAPNFIPCST